METAIVIVIEIVIGIVIGMASGAEAGVVRRAGDERRRVGEARDV